MFQHSPKIGSCARKSWKSSFWCSFSLLLAPVAENAENPASDGHFRWSWRLAENGEKLGSDGRAVIENAENPASDGHFRWSWRLWPKMLKIQLLMIIFADPGARGRKCMKRPGQKIHKKSLKMKRPGQQSHRTYVKMRWKWTVLDRKYDKMLWKWSDLDVELTENT